MNAGCVTVGKREDFMIKKTAFYDIHQKAGAKIVEFAGYYMPVQYRSITEEHKRVRKSVGLFDLSHMGEFVVTGPGARQFVQQRCHQRYQRPGPGQVMYRAMCYPMAVSLTIS